MRSTYLLLPEVRRHSLTKYNLCCVYIALSLTSVDDTKHLSSNLLALGLSTAWDGLGYCTNQFSFVSADEDNRFGAGSLKIAAEEQVRVRGIALLL